MPCCKWKCIPTTILVVVDISEVPGCHFLQQSSHRGLPKLLQELVSHELTVYHSVFDLFLSHWIMAILSRGCKPDNFESHNSLKLNFRNIWGLRSNFVECESFFVWSSPDILALCEVNLNDWIDSSNFSVRVIFF